MRKIISIILCSLVLMSMFVVSASAQESENSSESKLVDVPSGYNLNEFSKLYAERKLIVKINDSSATATNNEKDGGIILSGKPS